MNVDMMCVWRSTSRRGHGGWARCLAWRRAGRAVDVWTSPVTRWPTTCASRTSSHACSTTTPSRASRPTTRCSTTSSSRRPTSRPTRPSTVSRRRCLCQRLDPAAAAAAVRPRRRCIGMPSAQTRICSGITARRRRRQRRCLRPTAWRRRRRRGAKPRRRHSTRWDAAAAVMMPALESSLVHVVALGRPVLRSELSWLVSTTTRATTMLPDDEPPGRPASCSSCAPSWAEDNTQTNMARWPWNCSERPPPRGGVVRRRRNDGLQQTVTVSNNWLIRQNVVNRNYWPVSLVSGGVERKACAPAKNGISAWLGD